MQDPKAALLSSTAIATVTEQRARERDARAREQDSQAPPLAADYAEAAGPAPISTSPDLGLAPKTSWSMHLLGEIFDAYFKVRCRKLESAAVEDPHFVYCRMEADKYANVAYTLNYPVPDNFAGQPVLAELVLAMFRMRDVITQTLVREQIPDIGVSLKADEGSIFTLSIETADKARMIELLRAMQDTDVGFYAGPLDFYERKIDFSGNREKRETAHFVAMCRGEYEIELAEERGGNRYDLIGYWPTIPITGPEAEVMASGIAGQPVSPYSLADVELTLSRERKTLPPRHLRTSNYTAGIQ